MHTCIHAYMHTCIHTCLACLHEKKYSQFFYVRSKAQIAPLIRLHIHHITQQCVQGDLLPVLHRADKRKKQIFSSLLQIRTVAADWTDALEPVEDYRLYSRKHGAVRVSHSPRVVGPSYTQLQILRADIRALYDDRSQARKKSGFFGKTDLEPEDIQKFERFYLESFFFPYMLDFSGTLRSVSDLSDLWFRELFLEHTKCVQFPIDLSLPWILTEHAISSSQTAKQHVRSHNYLVVRIFHFTHTHTHSHTHSHTHTHSFQPAYFTVYARECILHDGHLQ